MAKSSDLDQVVACNLLEFVKLTVIMNKRQR